MKTMRAEGSGTPDTTAPETVKLAEAPLKTGLKLFPAALAVYACPPEIILPPLLDNAPFS